MGDDFEDFGGVETYRLPGAPATARTRPRRWLLVLSSDGPRALELRDGDAWTIGRAPECEVSVADRAISRRHAVVRVGDEVTVEDLGSANGTYVAGARVPARALVSAPTGSAILVGTTLLVVHEGASPPRLDPVPVATSVASGARVVADPAMERLYELVARIAPTRLGVLLVGETGAGKEVVAEAVHGASPRAAGPFVKINCAAIVAQLLESELFGHERGAFTGAERARGGLVEAAHGGTLLLDEIGEMPLELQAKLLRVIEDRRVTRVGAVTPKEIDVRFIAATHRDPEQAIEQGTLRRDLYYRLKGIQLDIPPLRERAAEIEPLAHRFLEAAGGRGIDDAALEVLRRHPWPGNVRELRNVMERAAALAGPAPIDPSHLPDELVHGRSPTAARAVSTGDLRHDLAAIEKQRIIDALARCDGNQTRAAKELGMPRRTLISRIEEYGLPRPRKKRR